MVGLNSKKVFGVAWLWCACWLAVACYVCACLLACLCLPLLGLDKITNSEIWGLFQFPQFGGCAGFLCFLCLLAGCGRWLCLRLPAGFLLPFCCPVCPCLLASLPSFACLRGGCGFVGLAGLVGLDWRKRKKRGRAGGWLACLPCLPLLVFHRIPLKPVRWLAVRLPASRLGLSCPSWSCLPSCPAWLAWAVGGLFR